MTRRRHDHADDYTAATPSLGAQLTGTMFDAPLGQMPAGSQPVETSERAADRIIVANSGGLSRLARLRRQVLMLYANAGDVGLTADEVTAAFGDADHNSYAPRVTELHSLGMLARLDGKHGMESRRRATRKDGTAFVLVITAAGRAVLANHHENQHAKRSA